MPSIAEIVVRVLSWLKDNPWLALVAITLILAGALWWSPFDALWSDDGADLKGTLAALDCAFEQYLPSEEHCGQENEQENEGHAGADRGDREEELAEQVLDEVLAEDEGPFFSESLTTISPGRRTCAPLAVDEIVVNLGVDVKKKPDGGVHIEVVPWDSPKLLAGAQRLQITYSRRGTVGRDPGPAP